LNKLAFTVGVVFIVCAAGLCQPGATIGKERELYGGSDWKSWFDRLSPFRERLRAAMAEAQKNPRPNAQPGPGANRGVLLKSHGREALYVDPATVQYVVPEAMEQWLQQRSALEVIRKGAAWLRKFNIDLVFVPVPAMIEVYGDTFADPDPAKGPIAPHVRQLLAEFQEQGIETVDLLPVFMKAREGGPALLYFRTDPHWTQMAPVLAAGEIARVLKRYGFARQAGRAPLYQTRQQTVHFKGLYGDLLTSEELAEAPLQYRLSQVLQAGKPYAAQEGSPVLIIGDSFTNYSEGVLPGTSIDGLLAAELNMPVSRVTIQGASVDVLKEFARDIDLRKKTKVAIWVVNMRTVAQDAWSMPLIPGLAQENIEKAGN
jgi:hypothetical protein